MRQASSVPIFHIVRASAEQVTKKNPAAKTVGVLSTYGTHRMGIYRNTLSEMGYLTVTPTEDEFESLVSPAIAMIKANRLDQAEDMLREAAAALPQ